MIVTLCQCRHFQQTLAFYHSELSRIPDWGATFVRLLAPSSPSAVLFTILLTYLDFWKSKCQTTLNNLKDTQMMMSPLCWTNGWRQPLASLNAYIFIPYFCQVKTLESKNACSSELYSRHKGDWCWNMWNHSECKKEPIKKQCWNDERMEARTAHWERSVEFDNQRVNRALPEARRDNACIGWMDFRSTSLQKMRQMCWWRCAHVYVCVCIESCWIYFSKRYKIHHHIILLQVKLMFHVSL